MSRYIDADALKRYIDDCDVCTNCKEKKLSCDIDCPMPDCLTKDWERVIDEQPTVDAVPVVRCKECIHRPKMPDNHVDGFDLEFPDHECPCRCEDGFYSWYPADDWFCADGERRTE